MAMTKDELKTMLDSTIVANGQKGITAESLNNALTEMVDAAGEGGSGDGALRIYGVTEMSLNSELIDMAGEIDAEFGSNIVAEVEEAISKNIVTYNVIKTAITEGEDIPQIVMDTSLIAKIFLPSYGILDTHEKFNAGEVFSMHPIITYLSPNDSGISQGLSESFEILLKLPNEVLKSGDSCLISTLIGAGLYVLGGYRLNSDGTIDYYPVGEIYIPAEGYTLTDEQKTINSSTYSSVSLPKDAFRIKVVSSSDSWSNTIYYPLYVPYMSTGAIIFFDGTSFKSLKVVDGEPVITVIGTLTAPTETA